MKKILIPVLTLVIGLLIGYYYCKRKFSEFDFTHGSKLTKAAEDFLKDKYEEDAFAFNGDSRPISAPLAHILIKEFQDANKRSWFPMRTIKDSLQGPPDQRDDHLMGYYINKEPLLAILSNHQFSGINFYFARDSTAHVLKNPKKIYTLIYMGATPNTKRDIYRGVVPAFINEADKAKGGGAYDFVKPCPDACGSFLFIDKK
jgi:hypothetical protein